MGTSAALLAAPTVPRPIRRITRLYREEPKLPRVYYSYSPEILALDDKIVCLRMNRAVSAATPAGHLLWEHRLPNRLYGGLGTIDEGKSLLIQTFKSKIVRLNPSDGSVALIGSADTSGFLERMFYAGDKYLIRAASLQIELWRVTAESIHMLRRVQTEVPAFASVDLLSDGMAVVTSSEGDAMWTVEIPSGNVRKIQLDATQFSSAPVLRVVTGSDRERGLLLALFIPSQVDSPMPLAEIDANGYGTSFGSLEHKRKTHPVRVMRYGSEIGVAHADGSVAWYVA
jgi:hypothetical protein